jgi:hypothetical protein
MRGEESGRKKWESAGVVRAKWALAAQPDFDCAGRVDRYNSHVIHTCTVVDVIATVIYSIIRVVPVIILQ